ncbi:MAG: hypothetical protein HQL49_13795, partial [Gammaproteobacteria bacterium]|nr:hypothetical protein [Gammaproteobacteria bacterium]
LNIDFVRHDTTRQCTAIGEHGSLRWNGITGVVEQFKPGADDWRELYSHAVQRDETYLSEWHHFLACVTGQQQPLVSGFDGLRVLQIIAAARESSMTGCQVEVDAWDEISEGGL